MRLLGVMIVGLMGGMLMCARTMVAEKIKCSPEQVTKMGRNPSAAQLQYYWLTLKGHRDGSGWPQLTYLFDNGHIYANTIAPSQIVYDWSGNRQAYLIAGTPSENDQAIRRLMSIFQEHAIILHPLY